MRTIPRGGRVRLRRRVFSLPAASSWDYLEAFFRDTQRSSTSHRRWEKDVDGVRLKKHRSWTLSRSRTPTSPVCLSLFLSFTFRHGRAQPSIIIFVFVSATFKLYCKRRTVRLEAGGKEREGKAHDAPECHVTKWRESDLTASLSLEADTVATERKIFPITRALKLHSTSRPLRVESFKRTRGEKNPVNILASLWTYRTYTDHVSDLTRIYVDSFRLNADKAIEEVEFKFSYWGKHEKNKSHGLTFPAASQTTRFRWISKFPLRLVISRFVVCNYCISAGMRRNSCVYENSDEQYNNYCLERVIIRIRCLYCQNIFVDSY